MIFSEYVRLLIEQRLNEATAAAPIEEYIIGKPNYFKDVRWAIDCIERGKLSNHVKYGSQRASKEETEAHILALERLLPYTLKVLKADELKFKLNTGDKDESELTPDDKTLLKDYKLNKSYIRSERMDLSESVPYGIQTDGLIRSIYYDEVHDDFYRITTTSTISTDEMTDETEKYKFGNKKIETEKSKFDNKKIISIFRLSERQSMNILIGMQKSGEYNVDYNNYTVSYKLMPKRYCLCKSLLLSRKNK